MGRRELTTADVIGKADPLGVIIGLVFATALTAFVVWLFYPQHDVLTVERLLWHRELRIEELRTVKEIDGHVPEGGRQLRTWTTRHTSKVGKQSVTSTRRHYEYEIERWEYLETRLAEADDRKPYWPEFAPKAGTLAHGAGATREQRRSEYYRVLLSGDHYLDVERSRWDRIEVGNIAYVTLFRFGTVLGLQFPESEL